MCYAIGGLFFLHVGAMFRTFRTELDQNQSLVAIDANVQIR
jgi:hypothetical protein